MVRFYKMVFRTYECGDEVDCQFHLFNKSILYALDEQVYSVVNNGKVVAFIDFIFDINTRILNITSFETIYKGDGMGRKLISYLKVAMTFTQWVLIHLRNPLPFGVKWVLNRMVTIGSGHNFLNYKI